MERNGGLVAVVLYFLCAESIHFWLSSCVYSTTDILLSDLPLVWCKLSHTNIESLSGDVTCVFSCL